jgi:hypothetical protein
MVGDARLPRANDPASSNASAIDKLTVRPVYSSDIECSVDLWQGSLIKLVATSRKEAIRTPYGCVWWATMWILPYV